MRLSRGRKCLLALTAVAGFFLLSSEPAFAFCATCYTAALGAKGLHALKLGILILLIPTVTIFSGLLWATFRYRNSNPSWPGQAREELVLRDCEDGLIPLAAWEGDGISSRF